MAREILSWPLLTQTDMRITGQLLEDLLFLRHGDVYIILSDLHSITDVIALATDRTRSVIRILSCFMGGIT